LIKGEGYDLKRLFLPVEDDNDIESLNVGQKVLLCGKVLVARDAAHKRIYELLRSGENIPIDFRNQAIYYMGPCPAKPGEIIGPCGPTTAGRMDVYTKLMLDLGIKVLIGKGKRSKAVKDQIVQHKAVYLATFGGAAVLIQNCIRNDSVVLFEELGAEAIRIIEVEDMPCIVAVDSKGEDIYEIGPAQFARDIKHS